MLSSSLSILVLTSNASRLLPSNLPERGFHKLGVHDSLQENCAIELLRVMRPIMGAFPCLSVLPFFRYSSTLNFWIFIMPWIWVAKLNNLRAFPVVQNMSEHVYYSEPQWILYRLPDSTHITQTIAGNTLVTELPQYSSELVSKRKTQISANGLIYNNLHRNQCNNFHISDILDFLWNSNVRKRLSLWPLCHTNSILGLRFPSMSWPALSFSGLA